MLVYLSMRDSASECHLPNLTEKFRWHQNSSRSCATVAILSDICSGYQSKRRPPVMRPGWGEYMWPGPPPIIQKPCHAIVHVQKHTLPSGIMVWKFGYRQVCKALAMCIIVQISKSDMVTDFFFLILSMTLLMQVILMRLIEVMLMMMSNSVQFVQVGIFVPRTLLRV